MKIVLKVVVAQLIVAALIAFAYIKKPELERTVFKKNGPSKQFLESRYKILTDSVADLEEKARILNAYLNMKHLEYIEVCDLVQKKKK